MRSDWCSFITPDSAIRTNRNGVRRRVIAEVTLSLPLDCRHLDLPAYLSDRGSGHYGLTSASDAENSFIRTGLTSRWRRAGPKPGTTYPVMWRRRMGTAELSEMASTTSAAGFN